MTQPDPTPTPRRWEDLPFADEQPVDASTDKHSAFDEDREPASPKPAPQPTGSGGGTQNKKKSKAGGGIPLVPLAIVGFVLIANRGPAMQDASVSEQFSGAKTVNIAGVEGDVELTQSNDDQVHVRFSGEIRKDSTLGGTYAVLDGTQLRVTDPCDSMGNPCEINVEVQVPKGLTVSTMQRNGDLTVNGFDGTLKSEGVDTMDVRNFTGALDLQGRGDVNISSSKLNSLTVKGYSDDIRVQLDEAPAQMLLTSTSGDVDITVPKDNYVVNFQGDDLEACDGFTPAQPGTTGAKVINVQSDRGDLDICSP